MCMYLCVSVYVCRSRWVGVCVCMYVCMYVRMCVHACVCMFISKRVWVCEWQIPIFLEITSFEYEEFVEHREEGRKDEIVMKEPMMGL